MIRLRQYYSGLSLHSKCLLPMILFTLGIAGAPDAARSQDAVAQRANILRDYVRQPDAAYAWELLRTRETNPSTVMVVKLTSQRWRSQTEVDRPQWEHWLVVVRPRRVTSSTAVLLIGGGNNKSGPPENPDDVTLQMAEATGSVVAELKMVPNQPLVFHQDGVPRYEDDLIAYAWTQYFKSGDPTWLPRLPMVKSAVRAMDCVTELLASEAGGGKTIDGFVVAGASKRGWTTWMTAAADERVKAIIPIVIDVLNVEPSMQHHAQVYGFWAQAIGDYYRHGIMQRWGDPKVREIYEIVDPYFHREKLTMPKFMVNAAGDQFFCPDSSRFYFDDLPGEKYLRYVPNTDHSLRNSDAVESITAFYQLIATGKPRPRFSWSFEPDGAIRVTCPDAPKEVRLWQASNPTARDFRLKTIGPKFVSRVLTAEADGSYVARADAAEGWTAYFVEMTYDVGFAVPLKLTTAVRITPDTLPHEGIDLRTVPLEAQPAQQ